MSAFTHITITVALATGVLIALIAMVVSLIAMILRWKTPSRRRHVIRLLVALATIPCLIGIQQTIFWRIYLPSWGRRQTAEAIAAHEERRANASLVHVGDSVPQFSLTTADGSEFAMPANGKVTLINFFATWCGPCRIELPHIERIWVEHKDDENFRLLVIGREETTESVRQYRNKNHFTFPVAADPDRTVYSLFARELIPRTLVVSPDGRVVYSKAGFRADDLGGLTVALQEQLAGPR